MNHYLLSAAASLLLLPIAQFADQTAVKNTQQNKVTSPCRDGKLVKGRLVIQEQTPTSPLVIADVLNKKNVISATVDMSGYDNPASARNAFFVSINAQTTDAIYQAVYQCARELNPRVTVVPAPDVVVSYIWQKKLPPAPPPVK